VKSYNPKIAKYKYEGRIMETRQTPIGEQLDKKEE